MLEVAVVEDDEALSSALAQEITTWSATAELDIHLSTFVNGESFLAGARRQRFDLVFLDIYMEGMDGIAAALQYRRTDAKSLLVFTTSSLEHMPQAFPCHVFDYLVKPIEPERLHRTLEEAAQALDLKEPCLTLNSGRQQVSVHYSEITAVVSKLNYCLVYGTEQVTARATFTSIEKTLCADRRFLVVNRGILVNLDDVDCIQDGICTMQDGSTYSINMRRQTLLKQQLIEYRFYRRGEQMRRIHHE